MIGRLIVDVLVDQTTNAKEELGTLISADNRLYVLDVLYADGCRDRMVYQVLKNGKRIVRDDLPEPEDFELPAQVLDQIQKRVRRISDLPAGYMHGFAPQA